MNSQSTYSKSKWWCMGAAVLDKKYRLEGTGVWGSSNPARSSHSLGGVARNVAENLCRLGVACELLSALGSDVAAQLLRTAAQTYALGMDFCLELPTHHTAEYLAALQPNGEMVLALADMAILDEITPAVLAPLEPELLRAAGIFADCNLPRSSLEYVLHFAREHHIFLAVNTVSAAKAPKLPPSLEGVSVLFCNALEAGSYLGQEYLGQDYLGQEYLGHEALAKKLLKRGAGAVVLTLGEVGVWLETVHGGTLFPALEVVVVDVTGAGDALLAGTLFGLTLGKPLEQAVQVGQRLAALTLQTLHSVRPDLHPDLLDLSL
jgi:pseudouridine kinase